MKMNLIKKFRDNDIPFIVIHNKSDIEEPTTTFKSKISTITGTSLFEFSAVDKRNYEDLIKSIVNTIPEHSYKNSNSLGRSYQLW